MTIGELDAIARFLRPLAGEGSFSLFDDAARLRVPPGHELVVTKDMIASGVHFLPSDPPRTIAQKALRVNLSDLAAKGAEPLAYLLGMAMPAGVDEGWVAEFCEGLSADQAEFGIALLGGDTISLPDRTVISVTAIGTAPQGGMVHRFAARPGDLLYVTGTIGLARVGLALLTGEAGLWSGMSRAAQELAIDRYRVPQPRVGAVQALRWHASAAMDVSDGLVGDCDKLAEASGCGAEIWADDVPLDPTIAGFAQHESVLAALLTGGDDYEILAAIPPDRQDSFRRELAAAGLTAHCLGRLYAGAGPTEVTYRGRQLEFRNRSYVHGAGTREPI